MEGSRTARHRVAGQTRSDPGHGLFLASLPTLPAPKSHIEYWSIKFERNVERDERTLAELEAAGWKVHVVWECQLKKKVIDETLHELFPQLAAELGKPLAEGWDE